MEAIARAYAQERGFRFCEKVGAGAFKETFLVEDDSGPLALKIIGRNCSPTRTQREIQAILRCSHPNIASLRNVEEFPTGEGSVTCLIEDYLSGGTLADRIRAEPLDRDKAHALGAALIGVLNYIGPQKLVHRDFKPENIMFRTGDSWDPIVVDFGLVRDLSKSSLTQSWSPIGPGTPLFAPPEQLNNRKELIDWRSDQFSVGVTLTVACGGRHPYCGDNDTGYECVERVASYEEPHPSFRRFAEQTGLPVLRDMIRPYPVQRIRTPTLLADAWVRQ
jgi:serine/threonine protein kinase